MRAAAIAGLAVLTAGILAACASSDEDAAHSDAPLPSSGGDCAGLAKLALPNASITRAELAGQDGAAAPGADRLPAFCRIAATLTPTKDSDIRIEVWMPAQNWNGKFLGTGNGGASGAIGYPALADGVMRGYAVAATDTGHQGGGADYSFAVGHPEKLADNAWRAVHEMTVAGKALVKAYYSAGPRLSYWSACSTGGRQGLKEAQRFPADYDGIVAGAPARAWPQLPALSVMIAQLMTDPVKGLPPAKLPLLKEAVIKACDAADGVTDRVINSKCGFDPASLLCKAGDAADCLTTLQVDAARTLYIGLLDPKDNSLIFRGTNPGSEPAWAALGGAFNIGGGYFKDVVHGGDKDWTIAKFDAATDVPLAAKLDGGLMDASSPDIAAFTRRGGKLILYHGTTDGLIPTQSTIDYYASLVARDRKATEAATRLFLMPGTDHCRGGEGASNADFLGALEQWVEHGKAPETITASKQLTGGATRTRPLCAYPKVAKYSGAGSTDDAANFSCVAP
jgi:feruloyl esterase